MDKESRMEMPLNGLWSHRLEAYIEWKELDQKLLHLFPEDFPKTIDWTKIQQFKQKLDELILDYYERSEKTFKPYSGLTPESFSNHKDDPLLNSTFLEHSGEYLATLVKKHNLDWPALHTNVLFYTGKSTFQKH